MCIFVCCVTYNNTQTHASFWWMSGNCFEFCISYIFMTWQFSSPVGVTLFFFKQTLFSYYLSDPPTETHPWGSANQLGPSCSILPRRQVLQTPGDGEETLWPSPHAAAQTSPLRKWRKDGWMDGWVFEDESDIWRWNCWEVYPGAWDLLSGLFIFNEKYVFCFVLLFKYHKLSLIQLCSSNFFSVMNKWWYNPFLCF